ncbi:MAG: UDP-N-acetylmuramate--L-alanine ligase [Pelotomaculum sp. PtaB.Bin104]|nr:MAG: UDP-N-acetylmuramate--L-alanine ligase [Pelotomaculum sp. PtaB.Bin104]
MKLKLSTAIAAGKMAYWLSRVRGYQGSSLPGKTALKLYSGTLHDLAKQVRKGIIVISGTNGKTTTSNMITEVLLDAGYSVVANREGANMIAGVTTSFLMSAALGGTIDCDYAVLEVDEASTPLVLTEVTPCVIVLTNFFRDQLDRYWELDKIIGVMRDSIKNFKDTTLILNADDPLVAQFAALTGLRSLFYGLERQKNSNSSSTQTRESKFCPVCGTPLHYDYFHYGQLGDYRCPSCNFLRPAPQVEALELLAVPGGTNCRIRIGQQSVELTIPTQGLYNVYNALAALSAGLHIGINTKSILFSLSRHQSVTGRMELFSHQGKPVYLCLVKNPTGFNQGIATLCDADGSKDVFIAINDNDADGRDISWLWDVDFEMLGEDHCAYERFICSGQRGEEMALRLKYAGIPVEKLAVNRDIRSAIKNVLAGGADSAYLFSTYTALWPVDKILKQLTAKGDTQ